MAAFADYSPGSGGSGGGGGATADSTKEQKPSEPAADPESNEANPGSGGAADSGGGSGGGGDWPAHSVMGLPSLSPTMSQGIGHTPTMRQDLPVLYFCTHAEYSSGNNVCCELMCHGACLLSIMHMPCAINDGSGA